MFGMLLAALDQTIVATAMPTIGQELHNFEHLPWIVTSYLLASTAVTPLYGKLSDIHGRRPVLLMAISTFIVGSVACALAPTMLLLIAWRRLPLQAVTVDGDAERAAALLGSVRLE